MISNHKVKLHKSTLRVKVYQFKVKTKYMKTGPFHFNQHIGARPPGGATRIIVLYTCTTRKKGLFFEVKPFRGQNVTTFEKNGPFEFY